MAIGVNRRYCRSVSRVNDSDDLSESAPYDDRSLHPTSSVEIKLEIDAFRSILTASKQI